MTTNGAPVSCVPCSQLDAGKSAICVTHRRAFVGPDCAEDPKIAQLINAVAAKHGITVKVPEVAISAEVEEVEGVRVCKIVIPVGGQNIALRLAPEIALSFAALIVQVAREAKNPAGLILPG